MLERRRPVPHLCQKIGKGDERKGNQAEENRCIFEIVAEFERELQEESDAKKLTKAQHIKKNVKKIREEKRKTNEVAKSKAKLQKKKKQVKEAT